jgi:hypothetical protein
MDALWRAEGLDLAMSPYRCFSTGDERGMLQVVENRRLGSGDDASRPDRVAARHPRGCLHKTVLSRPRAPQVVENAETLASIVAKFGVSHAEAKDEETGRKHGTKIGRKYHAARDAIYDDQPLYAFLKVPPSW